MFDVSWSELLILGVVTLIFVGPKELPRFLNTLGRYLGAVRRQANEFRSVFEQAMREAEMDEIKKEVQALNEGVRTSLNDATRSVESVRQAARVEEPKAAASSEQAKAVTPAEPPKAVTSTETNPEISSAQPAPVTSPPVASSPVMASEAVTDEASADEPTPSILPPGKTPDTKTPDKVDGAA